MIDVKTKEIQELLKKERARRGLNFKQFGILIGCTGRAVSYWETGERLITLDMADKVLKRLHMSITIGEEER
ncbi:helix-turn-helix domain-containing protein [Candidatus Micrarchaeota archaeon]|jgi:transcriptional regulator with XRE-family HTH domain|nr:helix-turn-helix domain-containing protein [Candidatus Micrarchaeota archaeon]